MRNQNISKKILHWYDNNKRILPWRIQSSKTKKEYFTLISEFMLQQTQVKTVIPYFNNFIVKIPNLKKLANVNEEKLMKIWQGLGYYSRAKNLKKTAQKIVLDFNGKLPNTVDELKKLPGIGDYTSRAIMAIAFNKPIIPLDGNVERIIKRVFLLRKKQQLSKENIIKKKLFFGKSNRAGDYAQAIMEIGALVCKPIKPLCNQCPISKYCESFKKNNFHDIKKLGVSCSEYFLDVTDYNNIKEIRKYREGKKIGRYIGYYETGNIKFEENFKNNLNHGKLFIWSNEGKLVRESNYKNGYESGLQKIWESNGKIKSNYIVKNKRRYGLLGTKNCINETDTLLIY